MPYRHSREGGKPGLRRVCGERLVFIRVTTRKGLDTGLRRYDEEGREQALSPASLIQLALMRQSR